ncbi:hypothetical protein SprV_0401623200 [Sparganum proliferum]
MITLALLVLVFFIGGECTYFLEGQAFKVRDIDKGQPYFKMNGKKIELDEFQKLDITVNGSCRTVLLKAPLDEWELDKGEAYRGILTFCRDI